MSWFSRGCCTKQCGVCSGAPDEFVADFGAGGWTTWRQWTGCVKIAGELTLNQFVSGGDCTGLMDCYPVDGYDSYQYNRICCAWRGPINEGGWPITCGCSSRGFGGGYTPVLGLNHISGDSWQYVLGLCILCIEGAELPTEGYSMVTYESATWTSGDCLYGADPVTNKIAMTRDVHAHAVSGDGCMPCTGTLPATIDIWAA